MGAAHHDCGFTNDPVPAVKLSQVIGLDVKVTVHAESDFRRLGCGNFHTSVRKTERRT